MARPSPKSPWVAPLPSGRWAILVSQPGLGGWWRKTGPDFETAKAAWAYAQAHALGIPVTSSILPVDLLNTPTSEEREARLAKDILAMIDKLYAAHPLGISAQILMAHFAHPYETTLAACRYLGLSGQAQWMRRADSPRKFLFPRTAAVPRSDLTIIQESVLRALFQAADSRGRVTMGYRDIARAAGVSRNSVNMTIDALRTKGYVDLIDKGGSKGTATQGGVPSTYKVSLEPAQAVQKTYAALKVQGDLK